MKICTILIGLAAVHVYFSLSSGNSKKMRMGYIRDTRYSTLLLHGYRFMGKCLSMQGISDKV